MGFKARGCGGSRLGVVGFKAGSRLGVVGVHG